MFDFLHFISHDVGTAMATGAWMGSMWARCAAGLLNAAKENAGVHADTV